VNNISQPYNVVQQETHQSKMKSNLPTNQDYLGLTSKITGLENNVNTLKSDITQKVDTLGDKYDKFEHGYTIDSDAIATSINKNYDTTQKMHEILKRGIKI